MPRVTKEELKGNELIFYIQKIVEFFKKYWEKLRVILLIAGVAILFITLFILGEIRNNESAMRELNYALATYQNQQVPAQERYTKAKDALKAMVDRYPRSNIKYETLFYLGSCHYFLHEYDEAIGVFTKCIGKMKKGSFEIYILQGLGKSNEGKGNYSEALRLYIQAADKYPKHFFTPDILLDIGRCYEKLGKADEAVKTYQKILDSFPDSGWTREAKIRMNILKG